MDAVAFTLLYEMRFWTSWAEWNALRRALEMHDRLSETEKQWLRGFSVYANVQRAAGLSLLGRLTQSKDARIMAFYAGIDPVVAAMGALMSISEPVNRAWAAPKDSAAVVGDWVKAKGATAACGEIIRYGRGVFEGYYDLCSMPNAGIVDRLAGFGAAYGVRCPRTNQPRIDALRLISQINDRVPAELTVRLEEVESAMSLADAGTLVDAAIRLHAQTPRRHKLFEVTAGRLAACNPEAVQPHIPKLLAAGMHKSIAMLRTANRELTTQLSEMGPIPSARETLKRALFVALDDPEEPRISDVCYALPKTTDGSDSPVRVVVDLTCRCPRCSRSLVALLDIDLTNPKLSSFVREAPKGLARLQVVACEECCGFGLRCFAALNETGELVSDSIVLHDPFGKKTWTSKDPNASEGPPAGFGDFEPWARNVLAFDPKPRSATAALAYTLGNDCASHIGGFPRWLQDPEHPACAGCGKPMPFLACIDEGDLKFSGAHLYPCWCIPCMRTAVVSQSS